MTLALDSLSTSLARRLVLQSTRLTQGRLTIVEGVGRHVLGSSGDLEARIQVLDPRCWSALLLRGSIGAGEAYANGWWTTPDLPTLVRLVVRSGVWTLDGPWSAVSRPLFRLYHAARPNTRAGSRRNISAHYDLSNEFFALFLDETLSYSCGIFEGPESTLEEASVTKIDRLCRKLELEPGDRLLEIGTGWGALAIHAAREYGCHVTTTTISRQQYELARQRIRAVGLEHRIELLLEDYRDLRGEYDKLVSVEMIEAIGHRQFEAFFQTCARLLAPDGALALQAITITDQHYEQARRSVDFIKRYIFPGSCIPSLTALATASTRASDLRLVHMEELGPHYARTLAAWRMNLRQRWEDARSLGHEEDFLRLWEFYLGYCEGGFAERYIGVGQLVFNKPLRRSEPLIPQLEPLSNQAPTQGGRAARAMAPAAYGR